MTRPITVIRGVMVTESRVQTCLLHDRPTTASACIGTLHWSLRGPHLSSSSTHSPNAVHATTSADCTNTARASVTRPSTDSNISPFPYGHSLYCRHARLFLAIQCFVAEQHVLCRLIPGVQGQLHVLTGLSFRGNIHGRVQWSICPH